MQTRTRWCSGLSELAEHIDSWIVDQFGVLHDGRHAYPSAIDAMGSLIERGDPVIVLSNSGKRNAVNVARLAARGFGPETYSELLTSGEMTWRLLAERSDPFFAALGSRCWLLANDGDRSLVEGLPIEIVDRAEPADFVLLAGMGGAHELNAYDAAFASAIARGVPAICANPDLQRLDHGHLEPSSGALARRYEQLGGRVRWIGKPHPEVYEHCRRSIAAAGRTATAMVGDSLIHDIAGGQRAGFSTLLVAGGIHAAALSGLVADRDAVLARLVHECGLSAPPDRVIERMMW